MYTEGMVRGGLASSAGRAGSLRKIRQSIGRVRTASQNSSSSVEFSVVEGARMRQLEGGGSCKRRSGVFLDNGSLARQAGEGGYLAAGPPVEKRGVAMGLEGWSEARSMAVVLLNEPAAGRGRGTLGRLGEEVP